MKDNFDSELSEDENQRKINELMEENNSLMDWGSTEILIEDGIDLLTKEYGIGKKEIDDIKISVRESSKGMSLDNVKKMVSIVAILCKPSECDNRMVNGHVYLIHSDHGVKIGKTSNPGKRITTLRIQLPFKVTKTEIFEVENMDNVETFLHQKYKEERLNGEWFKLSKSQISEAKQIISMNYKRPEF